MANQFEEGRCSVQIAVVLYPVLDFKDSFGYINVVKDFRELQFFLEIRIMEILCVNSAL